MDKLVETVELLKNRINPNSSDTLDHIMDAYTSLMKNHSSISKTETQITKTISSLDSLKLEALKNCFS